MLVTHDQEEALSLADALAVLDQGRIVQYGTPDEVIRQPRTRFVAQFLALGHFLAGDIHDNCIATEMGALPLASALPLTRSWPRLVRLWAGPGQDHRPMRHPSCWLTSPRTAR